MTEIHQPLSPDAQAMLSSLQSAVRKCLERKQRLGQHAIVWRDGRAQRLEPSPTELEGLLSERTFLRHQLGELPTQAGLTRMSDEARLREVERQIRELGGQ